MPYVHQDPTGSVQLEETRVASATDLTPVSPNSWFRIVVIAGVSFFFLFLSYNSHKRESELQTVMNAKVISHQRFHTPPGQFPDYDFYKTLVELQNGKHTFLQQGVSDMRPGRNVRVRCSPDFANCVAETSSGMAAGSLVVGLLGLGWAGSLLIKYNRQRTALNRMDGLRSTERAEIALPVRILRQSDFDASAAGHSKKLDLFSPHPWRRYFARTLDTAVFGSIAYLVVALIFSVASPAAAKASFEWLRMPTHQVYLIGLVLAFAPFITAAFIGFIGTSLGKWLFGISVLDQHGGYIGYRTALYREMYIFVVGCAFGLPIVSLMALGHQYRFLCRTKITPLGQTAKFES